MSQKITQNDIFDSLSPSSKKPEWPSLPSTSSQASLPASSIPPTQKVPETLISWSVQNMKKKSPEDYAKDRIKYAQYFQGNKILSISELVEAVQPKMISFIVTDMKTRRLTGFKKDTFEELSKAAGIPAGYFCRRSFATWDVLLPSEELATRLVRSNISSKHFRLQPEYKVQRIIKVTVCNVPIQLNGDVLAAYISEYGGVWDIITSKSASGIAHGDYFVAMCLDRRGFQAIPHTLEYEDQVMMRVVEGRKPQCWHCKQLEHFSRFCPQKTTKLTSSSLPTSTLPTSPPPTSPPPTTTTTAAATTRNWGPTRQR